MDLITVLEIGFGLMYMVGAVFNSSWTWRHGDEFFGSFADQALLGVSRRFVRQVVIPNQKIFTALLILFELLAAAAILSRGDLVSLGFMAGASFAFMAAFFSNAPGAIANLLLAAVQIWLALN